MQHMSFYCRSYCLLNMFRAPLCPSSGAREYYTSGCFLSYLVLGFQAVGIVCSCGLCVRFDSTDSGWQLPASQKGLDFNELVRQYLRLNSLEVWATIAVNWKGLILLFWPVLGGSEKKKKKKLGFPGSWSMFKRSNFRTQVASWQYFPTCSV
jgi:hypothetical protein